MTARNGAAALRRPASAACVLLALAGLWSATAQAQTTLVSNINNLGSTGLVTAVNQGEPWSQPFRTGNATGGYTLHSIAVHFNDQNQPGFDGEAVSLTLRANAANGQPGNLLHTLTRPSSVASTGENEFTAPPGAVLAADTRYHAVLEYSSNSGRARWSRANEASVSADGWDIPNRVYRQDTSTHWASFKFRSSLAIKGTEIKLPAVSVERVASPVAEGAEAQFRVTRTVVTAGALTVRYRVSESGDMVASGEEGAKSVDFGDGDTEMTVTVPTAGDAVHEADSAVTVTLTPDAAYSLGAATAEVTVEDDDNADPTGAPTIDNATPAAGETLRADPAGIGDPDGLANPGFSWRWIRVASDDTETEVGTGQSYTVADADVGSALKAEASFTDDDGTAETVASAKTATVAPRPTATLVLTPAAIGELGGKSVVTARLDRASSAATTLTVTAAPEAPATASDYTLGGNRVLTIAAGETASEEEVTITAVDNDADAPDRRVLVGAAVASAQGIANPPDVALTIEDDDDAPTVTLVLTPAAIGEAGGTAAVTARLDHPSSEDTTVTVTLAPVSPATASDFAASANLELRIAAGETASTGTVTVTAVDNDAYGERKKVTVSGAATNGQGIAGPRDVALTIEDDDTTVLSVDDASVSEGATGATLDFAVRTDRGATGTVTVDWATSDGTAVAGTDYASGSGTLTFGVGETLKTVSVPVTDDGVDEPDETVTVTLSSPSAGAALGDGSATGTIEDDEATPTVTLQLSPDTIGEAGGTATLTVGLDLPSSADTTVDSFEGPTSGGAPIHFTVSGDVSITIPAGSTAGTGAATLTAVDDDVYRGDRVVDVSGLARNPVGIAGPGVVKLTITEDEDPPPEASVGDAEVAEGDSGGAAMTFAVTLDRAAPRRVTVDWETADGTAVAGADYASGSGTLAFEEGESRKTVAVTVTGDDVDEPDETFSVRLSNPSGATVGDGTGTGTIRDDDEATLAIDSPRAEEGDAGETSTLTFTVTLDPVSDRRVMVDWADSGGGSATSGEDYEAVAGGTLTFAPGDSERTVAVTVTGDDVGEGNETVEIALSGATGGAALGTAAGTGTIVDNDVPQFSIDSPRVDEGDSGTSDLVFTVTLDPVSDQRTTVAWADSGGGTATSGTDHEAVAGGTLTFAPGDTSKTVAVTVRSDGIDELDETVEIALSGATGGADIATPTGTGTIADDDEAALAIDSPRVAEGDTGTSDLVFTVTLDPVSDRRVTVRYADSGGGTAASGTDHEAVADGTLAFASGDRTKTVTVRVRGDGIDEEDETVEIALSGATGGATVGTATGTGTIVDDDVPSLAIDSPRADETDAGETSTLTFTVTLDPVSRQPVTVRYADSGTGTATSGTDHEAVAGGTLAFAPGESAKTVTVKVTGDDAVEGDETVVIALSNPTGGATVGTAAGTGTIVDNEAPELAIDSPRVDEGDSGTSELVFTVTLTPAWDRRVTVDWADSGGGTATSGTDHEAVAGGTLAFAPGDTARTVTVAVNGDGIDEEDETVEIALSGATGGATIGTATGTGTIADDEEASLSIDSPSVAEGDSGTSELVFAVTLAPVSDRRVTVDWADSGGGTAASGDDHEAVAGGTLAFAPGESGRTVTVTVNGDGIDEEDETVEIALSGATGGAAIGTGTGTGTIRDDDEAALSIDSPEVAEGDSGTTDLVFTVTLAPASDREVVVDFAVGGTAEAGRDHDAPGAGSVAFAPGETVQTVTVPVKGDGVFELDETVVVTLSDPTGGALLRRHRGTGTIRNDDARETSGPAVWVGSTSVVEGDEGPAELRFPVTLSEAAPSPVEVDYTVTGATGVAVEGGGGSAAGPAVTVAERDMRATTGTLTFAPGETAKTIVATVEGDEEAESDGLVVVTLDSVTSAAGHEVGTGRGLGTVRDDDRRLSVEAADEAGTVTFTVALAPPTGPGDDLVTVDHETVVDGGDAVSGLLTFQHGETRRTVEVEAGAGAEVAALELTGSTNVLLPEPRRTERWLAARPVLSVAAPAPGSVKRPAVGETATVAFTVGLDRAWPAREALRVGYVKARDGEEEAGTLRFERGDAEMTVDVEVGGETEAATVRLADVDAARVSGDRDGWEARYDLGAGRGERRALALKYVLAATGRTVAANVVELVWDRAESHRSGDAGSRATVGGQPLAPGAPAAGVLAGLLGVGGVGGVSGGAAPGGAERRHGPGAGSADGFRRLALPDDRDLLGRTAFALSPGGDGGAAGGLTLWGRGTFTEVGSDGLDEDDDRIGAFSSEGRIFAAHLGLDRRFRDDLLAGIAVSRTVGDVDYAFGGGDGGGTVETTLTSAHPYVHWMSPTGLGVWGTAGYGRGSTEIADRDGLVGTDVEMTAVAAGVRDDLASVGGIGLAVKADAFHATVSADGVEDELLEVEAAASRVRLALEGGSRRALADGGELAGVFELGARLDDGDAERGAGADLALGFGYVLPHAGLEIRGRGSALLAHEESGFREWGLGLGLDWDPGVRGRGLRLRLAPSWGAPARGVAEAMWNADPGAAGRGGGGGGASLDARLGYGWGVLRDRAVTTAFGELGRSGDDDRFRLGVEFRLRGTAGPGLELYGERRGNRGRPDGLVALRGGVAF